MNVENWGSSVGIVTRQLAGHERHCGSNAAECKMFLISPNRSDQNWRPHSLLFQIYQTPFTPVVERLVPAVESPYTVLSSKFQIYRVRLIAMFF
jgi:hypothetical protein